jgi:hypothetical protein
VSVALQAFERKIEKLIWGLVYSTHHHWVALGLDKRKLFESRKRSLQKKTQRPSSSTPSIAVLSTEDTKGLNSNQPLTDIHTQEVLWPY